MKNFLEKEDRTQVIQRNSLDLNQTSDIPKNFFEAFETIKNYVNEANVLLDLGTHKGLFSKVANLFFPFEHTICFEPNSEMNSIIKANNQGNSGLKIENIALADKNGEITFHLHEDSSMNSVVDVKKEILEEDFPWDNPDLLKETTVPCRTLDDYIANSEVKDKTFFLKIDTQGNELSVLKHGLEVLKKTEILIIEHMFFTPYVTEYSFATLISFLDEQGFNCEGCLSIQKRPSKKVSAVDFLFVRRSTK